MSYVDEVLAKVKAKNASEPEFLHPPNPCSSSFLYNL